MGYIRGSFEVILSRNSHADNRENNNKLGWSSQYSGWNSAGYLSDTNPDVTATLARSERMVRSPVDELCQNR
jgi:hypothetical protein